MEAISIDVKNAVNRIKQLMKVDLFLGYDEAFSKVSINFDLTADEMDQVEKLLTKDQS